MSVIPMNVDGQQVEVGEIVMIISTGDIVEALAILAAVVQVEEVNIDIVKEGEVAAGISLARDIVEVVAAITEETEMSHHLQVGTIIKEKVILGK